MDLGNDFRLIPVAICALPCLRFLRADKNKIKLLTEDIKMMKKLEVLIIIIIVVVIVVIIIIIIAIEPFR
jgi:heme/copper-type cytochrome/quinol oxidase subunit 2